MVDLFFLFIHDFVFVIVYYISCFRKTLVLEKRVYNIFEFCKFPMIDIRVFNSSNFSQNSNITYERILIVCDSLDQFRTVSSSENAIKHLQLSDGSQTEQLLALGKRISAPGTDSVSSIESFLFTGSSKNLTKVIVIILPTAVSRHNTAARSHALTAAIKSHKAGNNDNMMVLLFPKEENHAFAQSLAVGRQFPVFSLKSSSSSSSNDHASSSTKVDIVINFPEGSTLGGNPSFLEKCNKTIENIRFCQKLIDTPPNILNSTEYINIAVDAAKKLGCSVNVIQGKQLEEQGFGGIWNVGKAAEHLPAMVSEFYALTLFLFFISRPSLVTLGCSFICSKFFFW
jgi:leucyl aminopeptidase